MIPGMASFLLPITRYARIIGIVEEGTHAMNTLAYFADLLGNAEAKNLLGETLDEEKAADNNR